MHFPDLPRHDRFIENYEFSDFVFDMEPVRRDLMEMKSSRDAVEHIALRAVRSVENGARRQIIQAVESDTDLADELSEEDLRKKSRRVQGWARVATGRETCAPDRVYTAGKNKGKPITLNDDVINALRRKLSRGEIKPEDFAFVA
ncbi:Uncharacterised protein [Mycobacteroides abscessus subsp. abscessus]|nr:Uncharacterised protein [Mycobacteroides abscessus subsp. abscessus]